MANSISVVKLEEVIYFSIANNYTVVVINNGERLTSNKTVKVYRDALEHHPDFVRVSQFAVLNKGFVTAIRRNAETRKVAATMANGDVLDTSYKTKEELIAKLS